MKISDVRNGQRRLSATAVVGLLDAAAIVIPEDASHVLQARGDHLAGELNGTSHHHLHHVAAVGVVSVLQQRSIKQKCGGGGGGFGTAALPDKMLSFIVAVSSYTVC